MLRSRDGWELPGTFSCSCRPSQLPTLPFRDLSTDCHSTPIRGGKTGELRFGRMQEREDRSAGEERILHPKRTTVFIPLVTGKESFVPCSSLSLTLSFQCPWEDAHVCTQKEKKMAPQSPLMPVLVNEKTSTFSSNLNFFVCFSAQFSKTVLISFRQRRL